jgi:hypothetical protein
MRSRWALGHAYNPASRSASVMASRADGGTEKPSASFSGFVKVSLRHPSHACTHTSAFGASIVGGESGSTSSGIESCTVPLTAPDPPASGDASIAVPLGVSVLGSREWLEDSGGSGEWGVSGRRLRGELGRSDGPGASRSFDLPLPKPLNAEARFEDDFRSGEEARPYGCVLCLRRPSTVPNRFSGLELCFSFTTTVSMWNQGRNTVCAPDPLFWLLLSSAWPEGGVIGGGAKLLEGVPVLLIFRVTGGKSPLRIRNAHV